MFRQGNLQALLMEAWCAVQGDPAHALPPAQRIKLYQVLERTGGGRQAHRRLALATARRVAPLWQTVWTADHLPTRLLAQAEAVLDGTGDPAGAEHAAATAMDRLLVCCGLPDRQFSWPAFFAGRAAVSALLETLSQDPFQTWVPIDAETTDEALPLDGLDTAGAAALAAAGAVWERTFDPAQRQAFWAWWLQEAIPAAWSTSAGDRQLDEATRGALAAGAAHW